MEWVLVETAGDPDEREQSSSMTDEHTAMIELGLRWLPYGGPPTGDIFVMFGLTPARYYSRLLRLAEDPVGPKVPTDLHRLARRKLMSFTTLLVAAPGGTTKSRPRV
ncbi:DUF3263 domain-containing protein [Nocardia africana]